MIIKQCAGCRHYFAGEFDGDYFCPSCHRDGNVHVRPLEPLGVDGWGAPTTRAPQSSAPDDTPHGARGQAA